MLLHKKLHCIHHVNAKRFETRLKLGTLNRISAQGERNSRENSEFAENWCYSQAFPPSIFDLFEFLTYWKRPKTGRWEGLGTKPVLTSYLLLRPNSTIDSLRQIVILQLHRHKARSAAT